MLKRLGLATAARTSGIGIPLQQEPLRISSALAHTLGDFNETPQKKGRVILLSLGYEIQKQYWNFSV